MILNRNPMNIPSSSRGLYNSYSQSDVQSETHGLRSKVFSNGRWCIGSAYSWRCPAIPRGNASGSTFFFLELFLWKLKRLVEQLATQYKKNEEDFRKWQKDNNIRVVSN